MLLTVKEEITPFHPLHELSSQRIVISRTPIRISFFGGGTDYLNYYERHGGAVLGTTINKYTYVSVNTFDAFFDHKIRVAYSRTELVKTIDEIQHPSARECLRYMGISSNLDIHIFSDLPAKTGLGSSSSFTVGFLNALYALLGRKVSKQTLASQACLIEQQRLQEHVGSQDQFHTAYGGLNVIEFKPLHIQVRPVILSRMKTDYLEQHLMIFYTGLTRFANEILEEQIKRTQEKTNDEYLSIMKEMVYEAEEILTNESDYECMLQKVGTLLHESWELKKQLSSKITSPIIDQAYKAAKAAGAYGGKLCGAGSGGFLALFVPLHFQANVREVLKNLPEVKFRFENEGSTIVYMKDSS